jgi:hypothetical protein
MRQAVEDGFVDFTAPLEGVVRWMYLDVKGLVTVGIGNLIDPLNEETLGLPFLHMPSGTPATREEIDRAWHTVKAHGELAHQGYRPAARISDLRLSPEGIQALVGKVLRRFADALRAHYPEFNEWPADAQMATLAMAWACGPAFHIHSGLKALEAALKAQDWVAAATHCHLDETNNAGLHPRNLAMKDLYFLAAAHADDVETLHWPSVDHVKQFQLEHDLEADGVVGPKTLGQLTLAGIG